MKNILILALALALTGSVAAQANGRHSATVATPGGMRLIVNGEWSYFAAYYSATATVKLTGCYTITKAPPGELGHRVTLTWNATDCLHTWLDADVSAWERPRRPAGEVASNR